MTKNQVKVTYTLTPAGNLTSDNPMLLASVLCHDIKTKSEPLTQEAYKSPEDFTTQATETLRGLLSHEMVEHETIKSLRVTIIIEY